MHTNDIEPKQLQSIACSNDCLVGSCSTVVPCMQAHLVAPGRNSYLERLTDVDIIFYYVCRS